MACPSFGNVTFSGVPKCDNVPTLKEILDVLQIPEEVVTAVYPFGSRLVGVATPQSGM